jgi:putative transferase (TIGR04331 family)
MTRPLSSAPRFLATTSLKSAWPVQGPDVFLGEWCFRFPEDFEIARRADIAAYPWAPAETRIKGLQFCQDLTRRLVSGLAPFFSKLLKTKLNERETMLLLGSTLGILVQTAHHHFVCLEQAIAQHGPLSSSGLQRTDYLIPETTSALLGQLYRDGLQYQVFSDLCPQLGVSLTLYSSDELAAALATAPGHTRPPLNSESILSRWMRRVARSMLGIVSWQARCVLYNSNHSSLEALELSVRSNFRIAMLPLVKLDSVSWPLPSAELRQEFASRIAGTLDSTPFEKALCRILEGAWPISLLEGLDILKAVVETQFPPRPKTIASGMAWVGDDAFKLWCVRSLRRGSRLVSTQHGGDYGLCHTSGASKAIEYAVCDRFLGWGGCGAQARSHATLPVPPHYLVKQVSSNDGPILYIGTSLPRWPVFIEQVPTGPMFLDYLDRQIEFFNALRPDLQASLLMRPNPEELGWGIVRRLRQGAPDMTIDDFSETFDERLQAAKLAVVDNANTTFLQSMGSDVPTILVWDPDVWVLNDIAKQYFDELEAAGVYFRNVEMAAAAVERVWQDPRAWWERQDVSGPVNRFLNQFFKRDPNWSRSWVNELLS